MFRVVHFAAVVKTKVEQTDLQNHKNLKSLLLNKNIKVHQIDALNKEKTKKLKEYKVLLNKVISKIEKWHSKMSLRKKGKFMKDEDFFDMEPSPSKFHSR